MAFTTPRTWVAGEKPTAATMNLHIRDQFNALVRTVATVGALPASGDYLGQQIFVTGPKKIAIWDGSAWQIEPEVRVGTATIAAGAADTNLFFDVAFTVPMTAAPKVSPGLLTAYAAAAATPVAFWLSNITAAGFRLNARRTAAGMFATDWNYTAIVL